mmetsp:Transcript_105476/g.267961  ORF Transcript_105476/g.267961 Transcript_105476/m.267961 type:complete len:257 (+) Transcript_105476:194-964(+)
MFRVHAQLSGACQQPPQLPDSRGPGQSRLQYSPAGEQGHDDLHRRGLQGQRRAETPSRRQHYRITSQRPRPWWTTADGGSHCSSCGDGCGAHLLLAALSSRRNGTSRCTSIIFLLFLPLFLLLREAPLEVQACAAIWRRCPRIELERVEVALGVPIARAPRKVVGVSACTGWAEQVPPHLETQPPEAALPGQAELQLPDGAADVHFPLELAGALLDELEVVVVIRAVDHHPCRCEGGPRTSDHGPRTVAHMGRMAN